MCDTYHVHMSGNITLRLDEKILKRVKHLAVDRDQSVSAWVGDLVTRTVTELDSFEANRRKALKDLSKPVLVKKGPMGRDEAHER